jgi:flagellin-like protein
MKIHTRKKSSKNAVSSVISVILMVAITVAVSATVYAYVNGMIGESKKETPVISFMSSASENTLRVVKASVDARWDDINITFKNGSNYAYLEKTGPLNAGDTIYLETDQTLTGTVTVSFRHTPTNTKIGDSYTFQNVQ